MPTKVHIVKALVFPGVMYRCECCVLSHSVVRPFVAPWTVAHQALLFMGILHTRILEWVAMPASRGSSQPRDQTRVSHTAGGLFTI